MKTRGFRILLAVVVGSSWMTMQGQYLAPRQYLRRLPQTQPAPTPSPGNPALPPGPTVTPPPVSTPTVSAAEAAKAAAQKEAATQRTIEFQKKRALAGSASAQYALGLRYLEGDGVPKDLAEACKWLRLAAKQDYTWAKRKLTELEKEYGSLPPPVEDGAEPKPGPAKEGSKAGLESGGRTPSVPPAPGLSERPEGRL